MGSIKIHNKDAIKDMVIFCAASHFCALRLCSRAQGEIRAFAEMVAKDFANTHPLNLVPSCELLDGCPEGKKFTCKRKPLL